MKRTQVVGDGRTSHAKVKMAPKLPEKSIVRVATDFSYYPRDPTGAAYSDEGNFKPSWEERPNSLCTYRGRRQRGRRFEEAGRRGREDVGSEYIGEGTKPLGKTLIVGGSEQLASKRGNRCLIRPCHEGETTRATSVCKVPISNHEVSGNGQSTATNSCHRATSRRRSYSDKASTANYKGGSHGLGGVIIGRTMAGNNDLLEDSLKMGRGSGTHVGAIHSSGEGGSDHRLAQHAEASISKSIRPVTLDCDTGEHDGRDLVAFKGQDSIRGTHKQNNRNVGSDVGKGSEHEGIYSTLDKARRSNSTLRKPCKGSGLTGAHYLSDPEACGEGDRDIINIAEVRGCASRHGSCSTDLESHPALVKHAPHSISRRGQRTRLPVTAEEKASPLHVSSIKLMNVDGLRGRLNDSARVRFDSVWDMVFPRQTPPSRSSTHSKHSTLQPSHADELVSRSIARHAEAGGVMQNVPFTVVEEKAEGLRQRFILWTKGLNDWGEGTGYQAAVPLKHISAYLGAVKQECATTRDFRTGFFAIEIPTYARHLFRFQDSSGRWFEMQRLPMGHIGAPELMHTLAASAAGHPDYVRSDIAVHSVGIDIFIDNIRYTGERKHILDATTVLDETASGMSITWKASDSHTAATTYTFLGADFNHELRTVRASEKIRRKISGVNLSNCTASQLESLGGRLVHASAIAGVPMGQFWYAVKFLRRLVNGLNRGTRRPEANVNIPPSVTAQLSAWCTAALKQQTIFQHDSRNSVTTFIDASMTGWGGVIIDDSTAEIIILGGSWTPSEARLHINVLESLALSKTLSQLPVRYKGGTLSLWIDNTSVVGALRKKLCARSADLNKNVVLSSIIFKNLQLDVNIGWVASANNPADIPSRLPEHKISSASTLHTVELALRRFITSDGVE